MNDTYDYIVIGSGAGGAAAVHALTAGLERANASILVLEKGTELPRDGSTLDVSKVFVEGTFKSDEHWVDGRGRTIVPEEYFNLGGKTMWYGGALIRFSPQEFSADAPHAALAWPFDYETLAPFYAQAEQLMGVRHFPIEANLASLLNRLQRVDDLWQVGPLPLALAPEIVDDVAEAKHFDGFASAKGHKGDATRRIWERLRGDARVRLVTGKTVTHLLPGEAAHTIAGVACDDGSQYHGRHVILAAGALHSPRLLQDYAATAPGQAWLKDHPGPAACVGRNLKIHFNSAMLVLGPRRRTDLLRKTVLMFHPVYPHSSVQTLGWLDGEIVGAQLPRWVPQLFKNMTGARAYGFWVTTEDGSHPDNRVRSSEVGGPPVMDFDRDRLPASQHEHRALLRRLQWQFARLGLLAVAKPLPVTGTAHSCGTLVTGRDPSESVVDPHGLVHGLANVFVADASVFARSSRVNPALTVYAWALRLGTRLAQMDRGEATMEVAS